MPPNQSTEYEPASWTEILCQCLPVRKTKPETDIEMQNISSTHRYPTVNNPVVPEHIVRANNPDMIHRAGPARDSWWLRDDDDTPHSRSGARNPIADALEDVARPRTNDPYTPPSTYNTNLRIAANTPEIFTHNPDASPEVPAALTPQWGHLSRIEWLDTNPRPASSIYPPSTPPPASETDIRVPRITPRAASYAAVLDVQAGIDARKSEIPASPASPTGSVDSIDFFSGKAAEEGFGGRVERSGGRVVPKRPERYEGASPYVA